MSPYYGENVPQGQKGGGPRPAAGDHRTAGEGLMTEEVYLVRSNRRALKNSFLNVKTSLKKANTPLCHFERSETELRNLEERKGWKKE